jgi:serine phosphatase RsbU (regulator of sigma subunit)
LLPIKDGDRFFLFSDGFADQFGGEKGKKFINKTLKSFLIANNGVSMDKIKDKLNTAFYSWKDELEQLDDVCIIGFRLIHINRIIQSI